MSRKLLKQLANCDLNAAAFSLVTGMRGGVYKTEIGAALTLFTTLPCPETAVNLVSVLPEALAIMELSSDSLIRMTQGSEEWIESFEVNQQAAAKIQPFLLKESIDSGLRVGFHSMRDQSLLYQRLNLIGIRKGIFADRRQFLRDTITMNPSAFRAVIDVICIHGIHDGKERFWNALGAESDAQLYLQSEIMYEISPIVQAFIGILHDLNHND